MASRRGEAILVVLGIRLDPFPCKQGFLSDDEVMGFVGDQVQIQVHICQCKEVCVPYEGEIEGHGKCFLLEETVLCLWVDKSRQPFYRRT